MDVKLMLTGEYAQFCGVLREVIRKRAALPSVTEEQITNLLASIQAGARQAWIAYDAPEPNTNRLLGVLITRIIVDPELNRRVLYAEALADVAGAIPPCGVAGPPPNQRPDTGPFGGRRMIWAKGMERIVGYAHRERCDTIEFDTSNEKLAQFLKGLGFRPVSIRYQMEVPK